MASQEIFSTSLMDDVRLKAYYRFESGALTTDSTANTHTLTAIGTPTENASGKFGGAVTYTAASSQAHSIGDHSDLKPTGNFSLGFWVKTTANSQLLFQSFSQNSNVAGFYFYLTPTGKVQFTSGKNTGTGATHDASATSTTSVNDNNWNFIVGTWDGSNLKVYVNKVLEGTTAWANAPAYAATNYVRVACYNQTGTDSLFFNGSMDDLFLINGYSLTLTDIQNIYDGTYPLKKQTSFFLMF